MIILVTYLTLIVPVLLYAEQVTTYVRSILRLQKQRSNRLRWQQILGSETSSAPMSEAEVSTDKFAVGIDDDDVER
jgi:hypothetical protein